MLGKKHKRNEARKTFVDKSREKPLPAKSNANGKQENYPKTLSWEVHIS